MIDYRGELYSKLLKDTLLQLPNQVCCNEVSIRYVIRSKFELSQSALIVQAAI